MCARTCCCLYNICRGSSHKHTHTHDRRNELQEKLPHAHSEQALALSLNCDMKIESERIASINNSVRSHARTLFAFFCHAVARALLMLHFCTHDFSSFCSGCRCCFCCFHSFIFTLIFVHRIGSYRTEQFSDTFNIVSGTIFDMHKLVQLWLALFRILLCLGVSVCACM